MSTPPCVELNPWMYWNPSSGQRLIDASGAVGAAAGRQAVAPSATTAIATAARSGRRRARLSRREEGMEELSAGTGRHLSLRRSTRRQLPPAGSSGGELGRRRAPLRPLPPQGDQVEPVDRLRLASGPGAHRRLGVSAQGTQHPLAGDGAGGPPARDLQTR